MKPFSCNFLEGKYELHVAMVASAIKNINLLAGLQTAKAIRRTLEAESLYNSSNKCNAQILHRNTLSLTFIISLHFPMCCVCIYLQNGVR
jgi:hypothetical protein